MNEIYDNINFDHFLFLESDMVHYYDGINKVFKNQLKRKIYFLFCNDFEIEYRFLDIRFKTNEKLEI